jgi:GNAT superfamily N-acetyltransferase
MDIEIVPMSPEWYSQTIQMIQRTVRISQKPVYPPELIEIFCHNYDFERFRVRAQEVEFFVSLDTAAKKVIGIIGLEDNELKTFFVDPDYQGKGIGRLLYNKLEQVARGRKIEKLILFSSPLGEPVYLKFGFHKIKTVINSLEGIEFEDAYMEKELA